MGEPDNTSDLEAKYAGPVNTAEAESWLHQNGNGHQPFPGLETFNDEQVCKVVWGAIEDGSPKDIALDPWALERFANIYERDETRFAQVVIFPAKDLRVDTVE